MNGKFTHYLITRYNVHLEQWDHDRTGIPTRDLAWMKHRESLFRQYCLPSVISQTCPHFRWLIYMEAGTPSEWLDPIIELIRPFPHIEIKMVDGYWGCMRDIDQVMLESHTPFIITSRLDNDDGLGKHFIETVQQHFIPQHNTLINLTEGIGYQPEHHVATRLRGIQLNHFSSYIEARQPGGGHISVRGFQHGAPPEECKIINLGGRPAWLKLFHGRNLKSRPFGFPVFSNKFYSLFGIDPSHLRIHLGHTVMYTLPWLISGLWRKISRSR